jgi:hypothetical protein
MCDIVLPKIKGSTPFLHEAAVLSPIAPCKRQNYRLKGATVSACPNITLDWDDMGCVPAAFLRLGDVIAILILSVTSETRLPTIIRCLDMLIRR